jgi:hypothetical protein
MFSSSRVPAVSVYPDSDKIGVWPGNEADELIFRRGTAVPWSDGEEAASSRPRMLVIASTYVRTVAARIFRRSA